MVRRGRVSPFDARPSFRDHRSPDAPGGEPLDVSISQNLAMSPESLIPSGEDLPDGGFPGAILPEG